MRRRSPRASALTAPCTISRWTISRTSSSATGPSARRTGWRRGTCPQSFRQPDGAIPDRLVEEYFGVEQFEGFDARLGAMPLRPVQIIERTETTDHLSRRPGRAAPGQGHPARDTIPHFLEFPIRDRATWEAFRDEFLDPTTLRARYTPSRAGRRWSA